MKALTLFQPYATLAALGAKRRETRPWRTAHRGRLAVHACKVFPAALRRLCEREPFRSALRHALGHADWRALPRGALLGTVELLRCTPLDDLDPDALDDAERAFDPGPGCWAWELAGARPLAEPVPYRGRLGFFEVPDELFRPETALAAPGPGRKEHAVKRPRRNRIKEHRQVRAGDLVPHEHNWRRHPAQQRAALEAILEEVGFARSLLAYELPDGRLKLIDGHLRADLDPDALVAVEVLDVADEEARQLLLTIDPLAALAQADQDALAALRQVTETEQAALQSLWR